MKNWSTRRKIRTILRWIFGLDDTVRFSRKGWGIQYEGNRVYLTDAARKWRIRKVEQELRMVKKNTIDRRQEE